MAKHGVKLSIVDGYPLPEIKGDEDWNRTIYKAFHRAAAQLGKYLASNGAEKDKDLAKHLTWFLRRCRFDAYSRMPLISEKALRVRNLLFRIRLDIGDIAVPDENGVVPILAPRQKISLPYDLGLRSFCIPVDANTRIAVNLFSGIILPVGNGAKGVREALAGNGGKGPQAKAKQQLASMWESQRDISIIYPRTVSLFGRERSWLSGHISPSRHSGRPESGSEKNLRPKCVRQTHRTPNGPVPGRAA